MFRFTQQYEFFLLKFSANYLELFPKIEETLKNPDERILTEVNGVPRVSFVKNVQTKNGNHLIVCSITPDGRIIFWTHMDSADNYIEKQRQYEKQAVEKYGLMNGDGNRVYMSYNKYLQQKADFPLYLATAEPNQIGNLQAELPDRNNTIAQKIKNSSADLTDFYEGAEVSSTRAKFIAASLLKTIAISAFVKFIGDLAAVTVHLTVMKILSLPQKLTVFWKISLLNRHFRPIIRK